MSTRSGRGAIKSYRRRKTGLEIDLNQEPGGENRELEGPSTQVEPQQVQASQQQQAVQMPQPAQPATIDVEAIVDDDVVESSPRAFAEAKNNARNNARRNRERTIVDVDLEAESVREACNADMAPKRGGKAPVPASKKKPEKVTNPLFEKRPKQFGIGGALPPKRDLTRFVKWPKTVQIQRKKRILKQRLKVPPALNQFTKTLDKNLATSLFKILLKYRPEDKAEKKERLLKRAQAETEGKTVEAKKPIVVKYGLNHVTYLIEQNKAQLVVIAHDVDPIELVVWLPALCRKMEIPYCIVKGKARLGSIVHKKTASVLCLTSVKNEDKLEFSRVLEAIKVANFNDKYDEYRKKWGGGIMGSKSQAKTKAKERLLAKEAAQRMS
ncbi:hypothetical protein Ahy_A03g016481 isoform C [Arachis hypogaea]|uniref:Ribosomal protein eL8/eL30/eS12/Gadd45 domain-containing protein n=1 Tax=Arachis hypogaea TaxID=3818 RepID=A0A445E3D7_ARAHY|nr:hypothetical protein Ahy_A03g016481 isoform C [Arachis hypogaea]